MHTMLIIIYPSDPMMPNHKYLNKQKKTKNPAKPKIAASKKICHQICLQNLWQIYGKNFEINKNLNRENLALNLTKENIVVSKMDSEPQGFESSELYRSLPAVKANLKKLHDGIRSSRCSINPSHKSNCYTGFVCLAKGCTKRLICSKCILEDDEHLDSHKKSIVDISKFEKMSYDRCIDMFADDIEKNSQEIEYKYGKKLDRLTKMCSLSINEQLTSNFPEIITDLKGRYKEQVGIPVSEINKRVMSSIGDSCSVYLTKAKGSEFSDSKDGGYTLH